MSILETYKDVLLLAALDVDEDGHVYSLSPSTEKKTFVTISKKKLALPTDEFLRDPSSERILFHPFIEVSNRGVSPVLEKLIRLIVLNLSIKASLVIQVAIDKSLDPSGIADPAIMKILSEIKGVDSKTSSIFIKEVTKIIKKPKIDRAIIRMTLKRNVEVGGEKWHRFTNVSMPFFYDFIRTEKSFRKTKDIPSLISAARLLFPKTYEGKSSLGSRSSQAPYIESALRATVEIAKEVNSAIKLFGLEDEIGIVDITDDLDELLGEGISTIKKEISLIPVQQGNEGSPSAAIEERSIKTPLGIEADVDDVNDGDREERKESNREHENSKREEDRDRDRKHKREREREREDEDRKREREREDREYDRKLKLDEERDRDRDRGRYDGRREREREREREERYQDKNQEGSKRGKMIPLNDGWGRNKSSSWDNTQRRSRSHENRSKWSTGGESSWNDRDRNNDDYHRDDNDTSRSSWNRDKGNNTLGGLGRRSNTSNGDNRNNRNKPVKRKNTKKTWGII